MKVMKLSILMILLSTQLSLSPPSTQNMLDFFDGIVETFHATYAPEPWKSQEYGVTIDGVANQIREEINTNNPSKKDFQLYIKRFLDSFKDYHVYYDFISTESSTLPFKAMHIDGKIYLASIDRSKLDVGIFPFMAGDEIVSFGGKPTIEVVNSIYEQITIGNEKTSKSLATLMLTSRHRSEGLVVPQGPILIKIKPFNSDVSYSRQLVWDYSPEEVNTEAKSQAIKQLNANVKNKLKSINLFLSPFAQKMAKGKTSYDIGARTSYIPPLGEIEWETDSSSPFRAYIYKDQVGKKIAYIRIPAYYHNFYADEVLAAEFAGIMAKFQQESEALVIDQINNPGGSVFYLYSLVSMLTDQSFNTPRHRMKITQLDVRNSLDDLKFLQHLKTNEDVRANLGSNISGYPVDITFVWMYRNFCRFIIDQWNQGKQLTDPYHLYGVDYINPYPIAERRYLKPVLVLINELDFSGGDFFPAILQDNQRAHLMGVTTAGAGGYVGMNSVLNRFGLDYFSTTGSLAYRINGQPIENLGVTPDTEYSITANDLKSNFTDYVAKINEMVDGLLSNQ